METRPARFSPEIRRALRVDVSAALLFTVFASLTTPFIGLILRRELGATPLQLSVMSAAGGAGGGRAVAPGRPPGRVAARARAPAASALGTAARLRQRSLPVPAAAEDGASAVAGLGRAWAAVRDDDVFRRPLVASFLFGAG